jgi:N-acetyl-anhydromuramyl-L-alanine amidase AmpD
VSDLSPNHGPLRDEVLGVMLHYSVGSYAGTLSHCRNPKSAVSYHVVLGPQAGERSQLVPLGRRAWHAGVCRTSDSRLPYTDANSAFVGVAVATGNPPVVVTPPQFNAIVDECRRIYAHYGWPLTETWRIVGHASEAWPRGRKSDPTGPDATRPVLSVEAVRAALAPSPFPLAA